MASFARLPPPPRDFAARSAAQLSKGTVSEAPTKEASEAPSKGASEAPSKEASEAPNDVKHREAPNDAGGGGGGGGGGGRGIGQRTRGIRDRGAAGRLIYTLVRRLGECAGKLKGQV